MKKVILNIGGMSCSACSNGLEKYLNKQEGIKNASVNLVLAQALIEYDDFLTIDDLEQFIKKAGFESLGIYNNKEIKKDYNTNKNVLIIFSILTLSKFDNFVLSTYLYLTSYLSSNSIKFLE